MVTFVRLAHMVLFLLYFKYTFAQQKYGTGMEVTRILEFRFLWDLRFGASRAALFVKVLVS